MVGQGGHPTGRKVGRSPGGAIRPRPPIASPLPAAGPVWTESGAAYRGEPPACKRRGGSTTSKKQSIHIHTYEPTLGGHGSSHVRRWGSPASKKNTEQKAIQKKKTETAGSWRAEGSDLLHAHSHSPWGPPTNALPPKGSQPKQQGCMNTWRRNLLPTKEEPFRQEMQGSPRPPVPLERHGHGVASSNG